MKNDLAIFEGHGIRRVYDDKTETWWFSVVDIIRVLTQQPDYKAAQNYWKVLKHRLNKEGSQLVTNCNQLKLPAADGKFYQTEVATAETLLRLVQSVPSPKAEPIKLWLAKAPEHSPLRQRRCVLQPSSGRYERLSWEIRAVPSQPQRGCVGLPVFGSGATTKAQPRWGWGALGLGLNLRLLCRFLHKFLATHTIRSHSVSNRTCQGYARKRILKPVGLFFVADTFGRTT
ncbi:MAG: BRO family protein [Verrucomicrobiota bacterium]